ncbi:winged helix-turn-helix domain-containing protein [Streptomyces sp. NBC_00882]|uniref:SAV_2336 N-terminal domain-related protein n=1 Tax=Streptomyces sp. NBC_00882 TaxID=2975856 RepID=UPI00386B9154|nr:winged helix-turn-helix domain-containing protein [Streptomyces sp. NBC_00882]
MTTAGDAAVIDRLRQIIADTGVEAGPEELADVLWLAHCLEGTRPAPAAGPLPGTGGGQPDAVRNPGPTAPALRRPPDPGPAQPAPVPPPKPRTRPPESGDLLFTATEAPGSTETPSARPRPPGPHPDSPEGEAPPRRKRQRGTPVRVGKATYLDDPLDVMRALRPLRRRRISGNRMELDEELTVVASVDHHTLVPVLRPARDRWLDLTLVVDTHRSMLLWHDLVAELRTLLLQTGLFRALRMWFLRADDGARPGARVSLSATPGGPPRSPREIATGRRHSLILILSDTVSDMWHWPELREAVGQWSSHSSVALLNVLPERLWWRTTVQPGHCLLRTTGPATPNVSWGLAAPPAARPHLRTGSSTVPRAALPVVDASPHALSVLASLVSGSGRWLHLPCLPLDADWSTGAYPDEPSVRPTGSGPSGDEVSQVDRAALEAVNWFEESASPTARELAGYLAAVPLTLPVMNIVRRAMLSASDHGHLAEVALGGLLAPWTADHRSDPASMEFRFLPGVRDALLGGLRRKEITGVRAQELVRAEVSAYLIRRRGTGGFLALQERYAPAGSRVIAPDALPFARTTAPRPDDDRPAYQVVADALRQEIASGVHPVGSALPSQQQLAERFDVSRGTVQRALRDLITLGLVRSRRNKPMIVIAWTVAEVPELNHAIANAFGHPEVTVDAIVSSVTALLTAFMHANQTIVTGGRRPIRVRVLVMGDNTDDIAVSRLRLMFEEWAEQGNDLASFQVRRSTSEPPTELYLINDRTVLTSHVHLPGAGPDRLHLLPEERTEETQEWFTSWWELFAEP